MKIEEYIKLRKKQDMLNEMDISKKVENIEKLIAYIFDFYKLYEGENKDVKKTLKENNRIIKYQREIDQFSDESQIWLIKIFNQHGVKIEKHLKWILDNNQVYLLINNEKSMEKLSYSVFTRAVKKYDFLNDYPMEIIKFMLDYHKIASQKKKMNLKISKEAKLVVKEMYSEFGINLIAWANNYIAIFLDDSDLWPITHRIINKVDNKMTYNINGPSNLFALNKVIDSIPLEDDVVKYMKKHKKSIVEVLRMNCQNKCYEGG